MTERTNRRRAPEHFSTSIRKVEPVGGDVVRLYFALERNGARDDVFNVLMPSASIPDALGNPCWQVKRWFIGIGAASLSGLMPVPSAAPITAFEISH